LIRNIILLITFFINVNNSLHSQCNVVITPSSNPVTCSPANISLVAVGSGTISAVLDNDFDGGSAGVGWNISPAGQFDNPCDPSIDGGTYMWMGPTTTAPRSLETSPLDVSCGGEVCFWLDFAEQCFFCSSPCEGPDEPDEGVYFEYSIDGGSTWTTINYFEPDDNGSFNSSSPGSGDYTAWAQYCYAIPPAAQTSTTIFQWWQDGSTSASYDHWGIDNVEINANNCSSIWYDWSHISGTTGPTGDPSTVSVYIDTDTSFVVAYTDGGSFYCTDTVNISFTGITLSSTINDNTCHNSNGACDGSATVLQTGGQGTINYQWFNTLTGSIAGATNSTLLNACAGDYYVEVTDQFCTATEYVTINEPIAMSFTSSIINESCTNSNGSITLNPSGGSGAINYAINSGTSQTASTFSNLQAGSYAIVMQDANLCAYSSSLILIDQPSPVFDSAHFYNPTCDGFNDGSIEIFATGNGVSLLYSIDGGVTYQNSNLFSGLGIGTYNIFVSNTNNCVVVGVLDSLVPPFPINIISDFTDVICADSCNGIIDLSLSYGGAGALSYSIDGGVSFSNNAIFNNICAGIYSLQVSDTNNCFASLSDTINQPSQLSITIQTNDPSCFGFSDGNTTLTPLGGTSLSNYNISWMSGVSSAVTYYNNLSSGTYSFSVTDDNGCILDSTLTLTDPIAISIDTVLVSPENCVGDCLGAVEINAPFAVGYSVQGIQTYYSLAPYFDSLCSGTYTILVENSFGCQDSTTINIVSPPALVVVPPNDTTVCIGGSATLYYPITGGTGNITYNWLNGYVGDTLSIFPISDTLLQVYGQDANGCISDTSDINILLYSPLLLGLNSDTAICFTDTLQIQAIVSGGIGPNYTFNWNNSLSNTSTHTVVPTSSTTYILSVSDGCETPSIIDSFYVSLNPTPVPDFTVDQLSGCIPLDVQFNEQFSSSSGSCYWEFGDGGSSNDSDSTSHQYTNPGCWDIYLEYTDSLGCSVDITYSNYICSYGFPIPDFFYNPEEPTLTNNFVNFYNSSSNDAVNFSWEIDSVSLVSLNQENIDYIFQSPNPNQYEVCLTVSNNEGCESDTCKTISIKDNFIFYAPNAFSPDGDTHNELFGPVVHGVNEYSFRMYIFNRWGELVYESYNENVKWDGTNLKDNKMSSAGVYVWKIELYDEINNEAKSFIGNVNLVR
jgi:large repetitive protein